MPVDVAGDQHLGVVLEDLLRRAGGGGHVLSSSVDGFTPILAETRRPGATAAVVRGSGDDGRAVAALTYTSYLALDEVLGRPAAEDRRARRAAVHRHPPGLRAVVQAAPARARPPPAPARGGGGGRARSRRVRRMLTILKTVVAQIDVLETMTPGQFASFRARLDAASGFQSGAVPRARGGPRPPRRPARSTPTSPASPARRADRGGDARGARCSTRSCATSRRSGHDVPGRRARARRRPCRRSRSEGVQERPRRATAATARRRRSPSAWSTSTRASRSGATAT